MARLKSNKNVIEDFGEKIGGAKKDLWKERGLKTYDLKEINMLEYNKLITKNNIWKKPDYEAMVHEKGIRREIVYFYKIVRDALPAKPKFDSLYVDKKEIENIVFNYVSFVEQIQSDIENCKTVNDCFDYYQTFEDKFVSSQSYRYITLNENVRPFVSNKLLKALQITPEQLVRDIFKTKFCFTENQKILSDYVILQIDSPVCQWNFDESYGPRIELNRTSSKSFYYDRSINTPEEAEALYPEGSWFVTKQNSHLIWEKGFVSKEDAEKFVLDKAKENNSLAANTKKRNVDLKKQATIPPILQHIERIGETVRMFDTQAIGDDYLNNFTLKGGQFGNWLNEKERKTNMNMAYDAFADLSVLLDIDAKDIGFNHNLTIAFGARGDGGKRPALAHYEPVDIAINLTKMKGAGSLGHEWIHALDHYIAIQMGYPLNLFSEVVANNRDNQHLPAFRKMYETMRYEEKTPWGGKPTKFYLDSKFFDGKASDYSKTCEMFARAASAYLALKCKKMNLQNDYLLGHALCGSYTDKYGVNHTLYPTGKEMERFGEAFEEMILELKEKNLLHEPVHDYVIDRTISIHQKNDENVNAIDNLYKIKEGEHHQMGFVFGDSFAGDKAAVEDMKRYSVSDFLEMHKEYSEDDYFATKQELEENRKER